MDPLYLALSYYRQRKFSQCTQVCTEILAADGQPNQPAWVLKLRALTQQVAFDDIDVMENLADSSTASDAQWTKTARPGTSLANKDNSTASTTGRRAVGGQQQTTAMRPLTRPVSGVVRLNRTSGLGSKDTATGTGTTRGGQTGRLLSRLGTASLPESQTFVNVARLNLAQYAGLPQLAKPLFEYLYFVLGDVRNAMELANHAQQLQSNQQSGGRSTNHYWKCAIARCMVRLGLVRQVIQGNTADWYLETTTSNADGLLLMAKAYVILDQPLAAVELYRKGLNKFPNDTVILVGIARIYEELHQLEESFTNYKKVLTYDANNIEAMACMASHFFCTGQHEFAFVLYRRLLQMGIHTAEVFCNIALCCLKTHQFDLIFPCMESALSLTKQADDAADIWYNMGHIALAAGEMELAALSWRLTLSIRANHGEACNNLAVLALMEGRTLEGKALLNAALNFDGDMSEAKSNLERLVGDKDGETECLI